MAEPLPESIVANASGPLRPELKVIGERYGEAKEAFEAVRLAGLAMCPNWTIYTSHVPGEQRIVLIGSTERLEIIRRYPL